MKKIKSKAVRDYVMNDMVWKVDFPSFLKEIAECSKSIPYAKTLRFWHMYLMYSQKGLLRLTTLH